MNLAAIYHSGWLEYREALTGGRLRIRLRVSKGDWQQITLLHQGIYEPQRFKGVYEATAMALVASDQLHDWYQADYLPKDPRQCYYFRLTQGEHSLYLDQDGVKTPEEIGKPLALQPFPYAYVYENVPVADWARGSVGYQIFPDRFRRAAGPAPGIQPWEGKKLDQRSFFGGDIQGIIQAIPYLQGLDIELVYLTPIFLSNTAHRYNTSDYYQIDPMLGNAEDVKALSRKLHQAGMRLILDGVFNHCGLDFPPFQHALEHGSASPYYDWFMFDKQAKHGYHSFAYTRYMPKLNLKNPDAQAYFLEVGRHWVREADIDGWRLDVSPEVWPDFWRQLRKAVKAEKADAILVAECWDESREWVSNGDMFDATMHYVLSRAIWRFFALRQISLAAFDQAVNRAQMIYPSHLNDAQWTFISSHDTARFLTRAGDSLAALRMAAFFQFTAPGLPILYYGDELGMAGGEDPDCRRPMAWGRVDSNPQLDFYKRLISLRRQLPALRTGAFRTLRCDADGLYAYLRLGQQPVLCLLCTGEGEAARPFGLPHPLATAKSLHEHMQGRDYAVVDGLIQVELRPGRGYVFTAG